MPKKYRVEIARRAEGDIEAIYASIGRDSDRSASAFVAALEGQVVSLERFPLRCPVIVEAADLGVPYRHLVYGGYRTIIRVDEGTVYILRVIHGARLLDLNIL